MIRRSTYSWKTLRAAAPALVALAASVAACGDGDKQSSASEYVSKADAICKAEAKKAPRTAGSSSPQANEAVAAYRERLRKKLDEVKPPKDLAARVAQFDALSREVIAGYRKGASELARRDVPAYQRTKLEFTRANIRRSKVATQIGFKQCGQAFGGGSIVRAPLGTDPSIIARADEACRQVNFTQYRLLVPSNTSLAKSGKAIETILPVARRAQEQIQALQPPAKDRGALNAFLAALDRRIKLAEQRAAAARRNDASAFRQLSVQTLAVVQQELGPATQLGFEVCGRLGTGGI